MSSTPKTDVSRPSGIKSTNSSQPSGAKDEYLYSWIRHTSADYPLLFGGATQLCEDEGKDVTRRVLAEKHVQMPIPWKDVQGVMTLSE